MVLIGLTGGIGMGKSTMAEYLVGRGERVVDSDEIAREMVRPGQEALGEIRAAFGERYIAGDGGLDRPALAELVFSDAAARGRLEAILHPRIRRAWLERVQDWRRTGNRRGIVVIPLLYETGAEREFDRVFCVACSPETQKRRLAARGWTEMQTARRSAAQWPVQRKMDLADGVIWNESAKGISEEQCARLLAVTDMPPAVSNRTNQ